MKLTLTSTDRIVTLSGVEARIWEGESEGGVRVIAFITRIAVGADEGEAAHRQFATELSERRAPSANALVFPTRMIL